MLLHITDTINQTQAVCHHTDVEELLLSWFIEPTDEVRAVITEVSGMAASPRGHFHYESLCDWLGITIDPVAPEDEPIGYMLTPEALKLFA